MQIKDAIMQRRSTRAFLDKPVPQEVLRDVLAMATRAISADNSQPWEFLVVTGEPLDQLREANLRDLNDETCLPDVPIRDLHAPYMDRARAVGKQIFTAMDIARDDKERRAWWTSRGYGFFGAPALVVVCMDKVLDEGLYRLEMGAVAQNFCLAAMEHGLGTCVEDQAVVYHRGLREILHMPENLRPITGIAVGYPDDSFPANQVVTVREDVDKLTCWIGFDK